MNIYEKIKNSSYQPKSDYPSYTVEQPKRKKMIEKYNREKEDLKEKFYLDLCEHFNLTPTGYAKKIFEFAWEESHSGGHNNIVLFIDRLLSLIKSLEAYK